MFEGDMIWWIIATLCGYFVKGLCGFANTLVLSSILSYRTNTIDITPVDLFMSVPTNAIMTWKERKKLDWGMCVPLTLLLLAGSIPGILFLKTAEAGFVKIIFGIWVIIIGLDSLLSKDGYKGRPSKWQLFLIGIVSGIGCGVFGVGALLSAYVSRSTKDSHSFKGNICFVFFVENSVRMIIYICYGIITMATVRKALVLIPFMLLGLFAGMKGSSVLDEKVGKKIVIVMLIISGVALIISNL